VIPERVIVEPALLRELVQRSLRSPEDAVVLADAEGRSTDLMLLSLSATERVRSVPRVRSALRRLAVESTVRVVRSRERFCVRLSDARDLPCVEARYLRQTNGGDGEGFFTKNIRRFSIPLSRTLLRMSITANQVTMAGFALAVAAGLAFSAGTYWIGI